jgi:Na+-transporting NADH:ubiquinone oxidoreductase subunit F
MMVEILASVFLFTGILLGLTLAILWVRARLVPTGTVSLIVNDERELSVSAGNRLLDALADNDIFVPSPCGGGGTCGQCRVVVHEGGGALLPTESSLISRREAAAGERLACQLQIFQDMRVGVPEDVFGVKQWHCRVRANKNVSTFIKELVLELPVGEHIDFKAGGYIQISCPAHSLSFTDFEIENEYRHDWERFGLFKLSSSVKEPVIRAYSMANYPEENDHAAGTYCHTTAECGA